MPTQTGAGIKRLKTKGVRRSSVDDLPHVNSHAEAQQLQLINQCYIYAAIYIFKQLRHFRCGRSGDRHGATENSLIERAGKRGRSAAQPADNFWDIAPRDGVIGWIFAFRRESNIKAIALDSLTFALGTHPACVFL